MFQDFFSSFTSNYNSTRDYILWFVTLSNNWQVCFGNAKDTLVPRIVCHHKWYDCSRFPPFCTAQSCTGISIVLCIQFSISRDGYSCLSWKLLSSVWRSSRAFTFPTTEQLFLTRQNGILYFLYVGWQDLKFRYWCVSVFISTVMVMSLLITIMPRKGHFVLLIFFVNWRVGGN